MKQKERSPKLRTKKSKKFNIATLQKSSDFSKGCIWMQQEDIVFLGFQCRR